MKLVPVTLREANEFVAKHHRHHKPVPGHRFAIGVTERGELVGVVIVGRPVSPKTDQWSIAEVSRLCTDGTKNASSVLYAAAARAARAMGYDRIQTFILDTEPGTSLRAAGWTLEGMTPGGDWQLGHTNGQQMAFDGRTRSDAQPMGPKQRWVRCLSALRAATQGASQGDTA